MPPQIFQVPVKEALNLTALKMKLDNVKLELAKAERALEKERMRVVSEVAKYYVGNQPHPFPYHEVDFTEDFSFVVRK